MKGQFLKSKEVKKILALLEKQWGITEKFNYIWYKNNRGRLYVVNKEFATLDQDKLRISTVGLYFGELTQRGDLRLTIDGAQLVGHLATKQLVSLDDEQVRQWMYGNDVAVDESLQGFYIVKHKQYIVGCGSCKEGNLVNFVSKNRRVKTLDMPN